MPILKLGAVFAVAGIAGAFAGSVVWDYFDPLGIVAFEGGGAIALRALLINAIVVLPFYLPWMMVVALLDANLRSKPYPSRQFAIASGVVIAGLGQVHPFNFVTRLVGVSEYLATMLLTSAVLVVFSRLSREVRAEPLG